MLLVLLQNLFSEAEDDTTPDQFTFTDQVDVPLASIIESNTITIAGINAAAAFTVSNGEVSKNGGAYGSAPGTVVLGDTLRVRHTSSAANNTAVATLLTVDATSDTFTSTTVAAQGPITSGSGRKRDARRRGWARIWFNRG